MHYIDKYIQQVIQLGDEGSKLLNAITAPTLRNSEYVDVLEGGMNGLAVLRVPKNMNVVVHSASGDPNLSDLKTHTISLVDRLFLQSENIEGIPIGFANVIDSNSGDQDVLKLIGNTLTMMANEYGLAILNGENAILGNRVNGLANVSGTMISLVPKSLSAEGIFGNGIDNYSIFDPKGMAIWINSDGVGTKTEFYERTGNFGGALSDSLAMKLDDAIKKGATAKTVFDILETKGDIPSKEIIQQALALGKMMGFDYLIKHEDVGARLMGYNAESPVMNLSGSVVSVIDEERLRNPLKPKEGDYLIAISGKSNPRSNGITQKREIMVEAFGNNYHESDMGKHYLEYLAQPSIVFYPLFKKLIESGWANSVYHMSGGSFNGKLARPLAQEGFYVSAEGLFEPDEREIWIMRRTGTSVEAAYTKWPMGNDGFITTSNPEKVQDLLNQQFPDLKCRVVGRVKQVAGKSGIEFKSFTGNKIYFSGKE